MGDEVLDQRRQAGFAGRAQHGVHVGGRDLLAAKGQQLLQQRLAVAHRPGGAAGENCQRLGFDLGSLGVDDLLQPGDDRLLANAGEIEPLAARQDGDRDLRRLGRAEDELHVLGRLFQRLEQGVERLAREHVDFVDDVDLVARPAGADADVLAELADFVDAAVAGAVDFQHVDVAAGADALANVALDCREWPWVPRSQLSALARMRAAEVLPTPRAPVNR